MGIGIMLGGVAAGMESAERTSAKRQEMEQRKRDNNRRLMLADADKVFAGHERIIGQVITTGLKAGKSPEQISAAIEPLLSDLDSLAASTGRDTAPIRTRVDSLLGGPTALDVATAEGEAAARKTLGEVGALEAAGVPTRAARNAAGVREESAVETIRGKIARGETLSEGEDRVYRDALSASSNTAAEILRGLGIGEEPAAPSLPDRVGGGVGMIPPSAISFLKANSGNPGVLQSFRDKYGVDPKVYLGG